MLKNKRLNFESQFKKKNKRIQPLHKYTAGRRPFKKIFYFLFKGKYLRHASRLKQISAIIVSQD
jgi:hypothetical protein